jgi:hypothetical protein
VYGQCGVSDTVFFFKLHPPTVHGFNRDLPGLEVRPVIQVAIACTKTHVSSLYPHGCTSTDESFVQTTLSVSGTNITMLNMDLYVCTGVPGTASGTTTARSTTASVVTSTTSTSASATATGLRGLHSLAKAHGRYFGTATDQLWTNTDTAYLAITGKCVYHI